MGAGTTEGMEEDDAGGTTVINNYYWNNTTTEVITEIPEMIAHGGVVTGCAGNGLCARIGATINTTAGQMIQVDEARIDCDESCYIQMEHDCTNGASFHTSLGAQGYTIAMPGSAFDCTHTIVIKDGSFSIQEMDWSLVYSIVPVTVG